MAAPNKKVYPLGLRSARIYKLNTNGYPDATALTAYDGILLGGPNVFTMDTPSRTQIVHPGNDGAKQYDSLPGIDPVAGTLSGSRVDFDTIAAVTGTKVFVEGETNWVGRMTDTEDAGLPDFGLVIYRQAKQASGVVRTFNTRVFPSLTLSPQNDGMQRDRNDPMGWELTFSKVTKDLTGRTWTTSDDGALVKVFNDGESFYRQHYAAFKADGTEDEYSFTATLQAANTTDMKVYVDGVLRSGTITLAVDKITFTGTLPTAGQIIVVKYPLAVSAVDED